MNRYPMNPITPDEFIETMVEIVDSSGSTRAMKAEAIRCMMKTLISLGYSDGIDILLEAWEMS